MKQTPAWVKAPLLQWALPPTDFHFPSRAQESVDSPIADHGKERKASRFLKADAVPSVFFFFFAPASTSLRAPVSHRMSVDYECRERHGPERKCSVDSRWPNDETTHYRKLAKSKGLQRQRSKVCAESADRAANTRCTLGQHAVWVWGDDVIGDKPIQEARLSLRLLGLFLLLKYSFRRVMLQLEFGESKPDESQSEQFITETRKAARSCSSKTLKSTQIADRPWPDALSRTQTFFGKVLYWQHDWKENDKKEESEMSLQ